MAPDLDIITKRLHLRILHQEDSSALSFRISQSTSLHKWMDWCNSTFSNDDAQEFIKANRLNWIKGTAYGFGIFNRNLDKLIGMVAITEIHAVSNSGCLGYLIADKYQRNGFATEALDALISFSFEKLRLTRLEIICAPENIPSHKIAKACGGLEEGIHRNRFIYNGRAKNGLVFSIIPE